jgi:hypothetical protein
MAETTAPSLGLPLRSGGTMNGSSERDSILREPDGQIGPQSVHDSQRESLAPAAGRACVQFMPPTRSSCSSVRPTTALLSGGASTASLST